MRKIAQILFFLPSLTVVACVEAEEIGEPDVRDNDRIIDEDDEQADDDEAGLAGADEFTDPPRPTHGDDRPGTTGDSLSPPRHVVADSGLMPSSLADQLAIDSATEPRDGVGPSEQLRNHPPHGDPLPRGFTTELDDELDDDGFGPSEELRNHPPHGDPLPRGFAAEIHDELDDNDDGFGHSERLRDHPLYDDPGKLRAADPERCANPELWGCPGTPCVHASCWESQTKSWVLGICEGLEHDADGVIVDPGVCCQNEDCDAD